MFERAYLDIICTYKYLCKCLKDVIKVVFDIFMTVFQDINKRSEIAYKSNLY
jgi:hypothetical protein